MGFIIFYILFLLFIYLLYSVSIENFDIPLPLSNKLKKDDIANLKKGQKLMTNMLFEFDRICRKYNLKYWCIGGTLIGVLRHQGWIPWDGDVDIAMEEIDYLKLEKIIERELPKSMWYQSSKTDKYFKRQKNNTNYLPSKIRMLHTCYHECQDKKQWHNGLQLDIFVYKRDNNILKAPFSGIEIHDMEYSTIFPLKEKFFDGIKVYIPNKYKYYSIKGWGSYPPKILPLLNRYPHEGIIDPNNDCDHHTILYPHLCKNL